LEIVMATGFATRFQGKVKAAALWLGSGGIVDAVSGIAGNVRVAQRISATVTAVANTDLPPLSIPPGATILGITAYTTTAFTAGTDAKLEAGISAGDATYVAATSIKALGVVAMTLASATLAAMGATLPNLFIRIVQSGTPTAVGAATIVVEYLIP
jgi:hypothetical protein